MRRLDKVSLVYMFGRHLTFLTIGHIAEVPSLAGVGSVAPETSAVGARVPAEVQLLLLLFCPSKSWNSNFESF